MSEKPRQPRCPTHGNILFGPPGGRMYCGAEHPVHYPPRKTWDCEPRWLVRAEVTLSVAAPTEEAARHRARLLHAVRPDTPGRPTIYAAEPVAAEPEPEQHVSTSAGYPSWSGDTQRCRYFNGLMHDTCDAGIAYASVRDESSRPYVFPCLLDPGHGNRPSLPCTSAEYPTVIEAQTQESEREDRYRERARKLETNICPDCDQPMTKKQVGPCVYAEPCGHRLYQGRVS